MPTFVVYVCDRCGKRFEGWNLPNAWYDVAVTPGWDDTDDADEPPEGREYVLCDDCSPAVVRQIELAVAQPRMTQH